MKKYVLTSGVVCLLALFMTGCETDGGLSSRVQEKSSVYAGLKPWEKKFIDKGSIAQGFTPDMVYIAMGQPTSVECKELPEGHVELWTYGRYYPNVDAIHGFRHANFTAESAYQPQSATMQTAAGTNPNALGARTQPLGTDRGGGQSIGKTGGPQGGSMEPADLTSYTIKVLFAGGKVVRIGADPNVN